MKFHQSIDGKVRSSEDLVIMLLWGAVPKVPILLWFVFLQQFSACIVRIPELHVKKTNFQLIENFEKGHFLGSI